MVSSHSAHADSGGASASDRSDGKGSLSVELPCQQHGRSTTGTTDRDRCRDAVAHAADGSESSSSSRSSGGGGMGAPSVSARQRMWRALADVLERFVIGTCGHAVAVTVAGSSGRERSGGEGEGAGDGEWRRGEPLGDVAEVGEEDEVLEMLLLDCLTDRVLARCYDASDEVR